VLISGAYELNDGLGLVCFSVLALLSCYHIILTSECHLSINDIHCTPVLSDLCRVLS